MTYHPTLTEDITRAKEILDRGRERDLPESGGAIYGADSFAAWKLLESFIEAIEAVGPKVCELAMRAERKQAERRMQR